MKKNNLHRIVSAMISAIIATASLPITNSVAADDLSTDIATESAVSTASSEATDSNQTVIAPTVGSVIVPIDKMATIHGAEWEIGVPAGTKMYALQEIPGELSIYKYYRVWVPDCKYANDSVYYLKVNFKEPDVYFTVDSETDGYILGDLCKDGKLDVFDMCLMRRTLIEGISSNEELAVADLNGDFSFNISDLVLMQSFLLGKETKFYPEDFSKTIA